MTVDEQFMELRSIMLEISKIIDKYSLVYCFTDTLAEDLIEVRSDLMRFVLSLSVFISDYSTAKPLIGESTD